MPTSDGPSSSGVAAGVNYERDLPHIQNQIGSRGGATRMGSTRRLLRRRSNLQLERINNEASGGRSVPRAVTSRTGPWTRSARAPSARSVILTTSCSDSPTLATTRPRASNNNGAEVISGGARNLRRGMPNAQNFDANMQGRRGGEEAKGKGRLPASAGR